MSPKTVESDSRIDPEVKGFDVCLNFHRLKFILINLIPMHSGSRASEIPNRHFNDLLQNSCKPTFPIIPLKMQSLQFGLQSSSFNHLSSGGTFDTGDKIIPDYNFQSLFRKKSHLRMARNKKKELAGKTCLKNGNLKIENVEPQTKDAKKGHWTQEENRLYHWFLQIHSKHFILKHLRRTDKIFKSMAIYIGTRQAEQCRSHHQKMEKKYQNFYKIISKLRMDFYNTCNTDILKQELQDNGINCKDLISEEELIKGEDITNSGSQNALDPNDQSSQEIVKRDQFAKFDEENIEQADQQNENLLGQNYENKFNFNLHQRQL